ncbi:MAG TPA: hypothetical protein VIU34_09545 [Steroidobacter sp.]
MSEASIDDALIRRRQGSEAMWQLYRAHAALLVCAYVGFVAFFAVTDPHDPVAALFKQRPPAEELQQLPAVTPPPTVQANAAPVAADRNISAADEATPDADSDAVARQQERTRISEVSLQATRSEQPQERAAAIDQLKSVSPEALQALQAVVTSDSVARNRIRALNSLRVLAEQDGAKDAVISIVHLATVDTNASVASRANEVYRELTQEQQAPVE